MRLKKAICILLAALLSAVILCSCEGFSWDMLFGSQTESAPLMSVHFLDVGQGDAIFVELPNDKTMLIDSGENYHGEGIINYIRDCGSKRIDYLIGTHPHSDHIGSLPYITRPSGSSIISRLRAKQSRPSTIPISFPSQSYRQFGRISKI